LFLDNSPNKLRSRLRGKTDLAETSVSVGEKTYRIVYPEMADALIDEAEFDQDERLPYWADLWPSALALACHLSGRDLSGERVLELGCGVGLPGVVALDRRAEVLMTDHYKAALDFASYNARINTSREPRTMLLDWHEPPAQIGTFDHVIAADVLYERRNIPSLASLVPALLAPEGEALFADPRRKDTPLFVEEMKEKGFRHEVENFAVEQGGREIEVLLHTLRRTGWRKA
jgi:predicted nicotinamide N-methyase